MEMDTQSFYPLVQFPNAHKSQGKARNQELSLSLPGWVAGTQVLELSPVAFQVHFSKKLQLEAELTLNPGTLQDEVSLKWDLNRTPAACLFM